MKKVFFTLVLSGSIFISMSLESLAQQSTDIKKSLEYRIQRGVYNRAIKYNDADMAISALYNLCTMEPQNDSLLYSLAYLYFDNQRYFSAILACNDLLLLNPENLKAMQMKAVGLEQIGAKDKALEEYESLYLKSDNDINYLYKMAVLDYELKRYQEAKNNIKILMGKDKIDEIKYYFPTENKDQQEISMKASLYNLNGLIALDEGNKDEARQQFGRALEIAPDFYQAKKNMDSLSN